ncbi:cysteine desulfurase-like protein [Streptomyces griseoloalbus]|uniref:cysteine desulfurase-like protein n=1 Tax=Streptomyces griseoloalbus TaxID=67303 RepID=UPI001874828A|nr:cysteine desulfurase-like protein [Streptomyces griseoloalbus]
MTVTDPTTTTGLRHRFPGLRGDWARLDGPGGTQVVDTAVEAMTRYLTSGDNANTEGMFAAADATDEVVARGRAAMGELFGTDPRGVVFGPNTTSLVIDLAQTVAAGLGPGDEIVCTRLDHDANVAPWLRIAARTGATVHLADVDTDTGRLPTENVTRLLSDRTRWVAVTGASNALGSIPDVAAIATAAHAAGARVLVDAVHLTPHRPVDRTALGADVLVSSAYKWYGPHLGVLCADPGLLDALDPDRVRPAPQEAPDRWQTGTPSFEAIAAATEAARFVLDHARAVDETAVFAPLLDGLLAMPHVRVHGPHDHTDRTPTVAFTVAGHPADDVARHLARQKIATWSGIFYAHEVMHALGLHEDGAVRAGLSCYTSTEDVDRLLRAVDALA